MKSEEGRGGSNVTWERYGKGESNGTWEVYGKGGEYTTTNAH